MTEIIREKDSGLDWIAKIVEVFIVISISISFITMGSGLKNFLDGYVDTITKVIEAREDNIFHRLPPFLWWVTPSLTFRVLLYVLSFGFCIGFAAGNPSCFLVLLEYFGTFSSPILHVKKKKKKD